MAAQDLPQREMLLLWSRRRSMTVEKVNHFDVLVKLPTDGQKKDVSVSATMTLRSGNKNWNYWKPSHGESRLIDAVIKRAKLISHCNNVAVAAIEIDIGIFQCLIGTDHNGEPAISFKVVFMEGNDTYTCHLWLFFGSDPRKGVRLPNLQLRAVRDSGIDGAPIADESGLIDGYEGFFQYGGGSPRE
jgi:hypothetical protein